MKNIIIGFLLLSILSCKAQIIPVEDYITEYRNLDLDIPDGAYIKDVNGVLDKYVGTWVGTYDSKTYELRIIEYTDGFLGINEDKLLIRYKITDSIGVILEDITTLPNDDFLVIKGNYLSETGTYYVLDYNGSEYECGQNGFIFIAVGDDTNIMRFHLGIKGEMYPEDCPNGMASQILPTEQITLIKQ